MTSIESLILPDRCLAVYVDDTGHEALVPGHPVYGLGGCAVLGRDLNRLISEPWRNLRKRVTGSPNVQLRAHSFATIAKRQHDSDSIMEEMAAIFRQQFLRFGAIISNKTKLSDEIDPVQTIKAVLQARINHLIQANPCREVKVIFESSERANHLIENAFQDFELHRGWKRIPSECYFMPKTAADPALEVADFVMHAVGRQARYKLKGSDGFVRDFSAVFHSVDQRFVSFMAVESVERSE
jgi:hypothetical protein